MLKKLLAAVFAATLMTGTVMGADDYVWNGAAWVQIDGTTAADPTTVGTITDGDAAYISNDDTTEKATNVGTIVVGGAGGSSLTIGESSVNFPTPPGSGSKATGPVVVTAASIATDGANNGTVNIKAGSTLNVTGAVTLGADNSNVITNAGKMTINGTLTAGVGSVITNTGAELTLAGLGTDDLAAALGATDVGTVNLTNVGAFGVAAFTSTATAGTFKVAEQTAAAAGAVDFGGADAQLGGGDYTAGAISAKSLTLTGGSTKIANALVTTNGTTINSAATLEVAGNITLANSAPFEIKNSGTIKIAAGNTLTMGDNYVSTSGKIDNSLNATANGLVIDTTANTTAAQANSFLTDLAAGGAAGAIGNVKFNDTVDTGDIAATGTIGSGNVELAGAQADATQSVNVGGATLKITNASTNKFKDVTAATITNVAGAAVEYNGAVKGNLDAQENVTFKTGSAFSEGNVAITGGKTVDVEAGATFSVDAAKTIDFNTTGVLKNSGGTVTIASTAAALNAAAGVLAIDSTTAITNLNSAEAAKLVEFIDNGGAFDLGELNINADAGDTTINLSSAKANGIVNFNAGQASNTKAVNFGNADVNFLAGESTFTNTFAAKTTTIGDVAGTKTASVAFGNATATNSVINSAVTVNKGSTFATTGAGTYLGVGPAASLDVKEGGIISIGNDGADAASTLNGDAGGNAVTINNKALLSINNKVTSGDVFNADFVSSVIASGMSQSDFEAWLAANSVNNVLTQGEFELVGGKVTYSGKAQTNAGGAVRSAMARNGAGDFAPLLNNTAIAGIAAGAAIVADPAAYAALPTDKDRFNADVLDALGGSTNANLGSYQGRGNLAYAGYRWATGQDLANTVEATTDTVRNFGKAIISQAIRPNPANTATFGSYEGYAAPLTMLDCNNYANRIWAGYTGMWGDADARGGDRGYEYDAHGFNIGYDRAFSNGFSFGAAFGYSSGDFDLKGGLGSDGDIDNYSFALYGSWKHCSGLYTTILGSYTYSDYDMNNQYALNTWDRADYHGNTWSFGGEVGYELRPAQNFALIPSIGLYYYDTSTNRFNTSSGRLGMKYSNHSIEMPLEVTAKYDVCIGAETNLTLVANGGYTYNFRDKGTKIDRFVMGGTGIVMGGDRGRSAGHSGWNIGGGANLQYRNFDFGVNYEYNARSDYDSHNLWVNAGVRF